MITSLTREAVKFGLQLHMGNTKILTNTLDSRPSHITCSGNDVEGLSADASQKYFGRALSIDDCHLTEFKNRIASGWASFFKSKACLCNSKIFLKNHLRLFNAVVTPCVSYACGTWAMTENMSRELRTVQRRMLRWMMPTARLDQEDWVTYIQRATSRVEAIARNWGGHSSDYASGS